MAGLYLLGIAHVGENRKIRRLEVCRCLGGQHGHVRGGSVGPLCAPLPRRLEYLGRGGGALLKCRNHEHDCKWWRACPHFNTHEWVGCRGGCLLPLPGQRWASPMWSRASCCRRWGWREGRLHGRFLQDQWEWLRAAFLASPLPLHATAAPTTTGFKGSAANSKHVGDIAKWLRQAEPKMMAGAAESGHQEAERRQRRRHRLSGSWRGCRA